MHPLIAIIIGAYIWFAGLMIGIGWARRPCRVCARRRAQADEDALIERRAQAVAKRADEIRRDGGTEPPG